MANSTICLFFSDTGGGHRSATEAVHAGILSLCASTPERQINVVSDNVVEKSHSINRFFVDIYNFLLRHNQACMKYYFWFVNHFQPDNSKLGYLLVRAYMKKILDELRPGVIVSIHPMINKYVARGLKEFDPNGKISFVIVVTDPNDRLWKGWACPEANLTIVPNEAAKNKLLSWGVPENKLQVVGMPVHPNFIQPASSERAEFLSHLGLDPKVFTLCINAGWAGGGNMRAVYKALHKANKKMQVIFLCGHNYRLYNKISKQAAASDIPTRILPFHDNMSELMNAIDLMVTKAGGLTTFEAIARRLPIAIDTITHPMPQEAGTIDILLKHELAQVIKKPEDIVRIVENAELKANIVQKELPTAQSLNKIEATYDIAKLVLSHLDAKVEVLR